MYKHSRDMLKQLRDDEPGIFAHLVAMNLNEEIGKPQEKFLRAFN